MRTEEGSIGECLAACVGVLMLSILLVSYMDSVEIIQKKAEVSQIARKYILEMESKGYLSEEDAGALIKELEKTGLKEIRLEGTSFTRVGYGSPIALQIKGSLGEAYEVEEKKVSTAKN